MNSPILANAIPVESTLKSNLPHDLVQPRRSQIYVGFKCSQKCGFCYYKHRCSEKMFDVDFVRRQIDFKLKYGIRDFEITGGEPGEFQNLEEICQYIKDRSPSSKIAVISNGSVCTKPKVFTIIDELLLSYHFPRNSQSSSMFPNGCTFSKAMKSVELSRQNNLILRTNTVLGAFNLEFLSSIIDDLVQFNPLVVNFLPLNLFDQAENLANQINYIKLRPILKNAVDQLKTKLPMAKIYIRYMPFCDMVGYEQHLVGHVQHIYDWFDWNVELGGIEYLDQLQNSAESLLDSLGMYGSTSLKVALQNRCHLYTKSSKCLRCKYFLICDGIEKQIPSQLADKFMIPQIDGKIEKNPLKYIGQTSYQLYQQIYG